MAGGKDGNCGRLLPDGTGWTNCRMLINAFHWLWPTSGVGRCSVRLTLLSPGMAGQSLKVLELKFLPSLFLLSRVNLAMALAHSPPLGFFVRLPVGISISRGRAIDGSPIACRSRE